MQDKLKDFLLITTNFGTQSTNCCLELIFAEQEISELIDIQNGFYLYEKPLPITRIKGIFFVDREQKEQTIININMSTAFVPESLIKVVEKFDNPSMDKIKQPSDIHINLFDKQIQTFDGFLGGFALLRYAGEDYMNYSENYFSTLAVYSSKIKSELPNNVQLKNLFETPLFKEVSPFLRKKIDETTVAEQANKENQDINKAKDKYTRKIDLTQLDKVTYILATLNTFSVGQESKALKIDDLILSNFKSKILSDKPDKSEIIALCYGINRGYSVFSKSYGSKNIKFKLDSQLDYYTIESLYQFSFYDKKDSFKFSYLDWCPKLKTGKIKKTDYQILDVVVIGKKKAKVSSLEYLENLLLQVFQKDNVSLFRELLEKVREIIYNDAKDEITDDYENQIAQKQEEIENLKAKQKRLLDESQKTVLTKEYKQQEEQPIATVAEPQTPYLPKQDIKKIVEQIYDYQSKTMNMLKKEAKDRGISTDGKKEDIIMNLLITPNNRIDFNG
ncbi:hypothetical protein AGMMS50239_06160 [Bacteroidia bacterium]|nr:hypothetical protein AGMMS50239_06160 [Bacteroidia bacterium]